MESRVKPFLDHLSVELETLTEEGLHKEERVIASQQQALVTVGGEELLNLCANNYLGLANHPDIIRASQEGLSARGFGVASVRFICGTQDIHKELEGRLTEFLGTEDTILYSSCFDANVGLFETILSAEDAIISDELNHASIIDGVRLSKAQRFRYANNDMADLRRQLEAASGARFKLIVTDGVFSMDGVIADLKSIVDLAEEFGALVMVDDSHATGFVGEKGRGTPELTGTLGRIDIITSTLGKALGGASGGFTSGRKEIVAWLRQRSRPYLFSNSLAPGVVTASLTALDMLEASDSLRAQLKENTDYFRKAMTDAGFTLAGEGHAIIPVMIGDAALATQMADELLKRGIYVIGFSFPVVPRGEARIRTQMSAVHTRAQLKHAVEAFTEVGRELGVIA